MKRLFLLSAIALVAICSSSCGSCGSSQSGAPAKPEPPVRYGWDGIPLYGDVESVVITTYKFEGEFGEVVRVDIEDCEKYFFNQAGDVIERDKYDTDGSLDEKTIYKYDASGNRIEITEYRGVAHLPHSQTVYEITYRN